MSETSCILYSDGGGEKNSTAASACILVLPKTATIFRMSLFLGAGTNNQAEISAGLLGFALISFLNRSSKNIAIKRVKWVCDSEYVLKSATEYIKTWQKNGWKTASKSPVKNQLLWRMYLAITEGLEILPQHVYGHTGHKENELCDQAATWTRENALSTFSGNSSTSRAKNYLLSKLTLPIANEEQDWLVIDGRNYLTWMSDNNIDSKELMINNAWQNFEKIFSKIA